MHLRSYCRQCLIIIALVIVSTSALLVAAGNKFSIDLIPAYVIPIGQGAERGMVSPDGKRLAVWVSDADRGYVWIDGKRSRQWDAILLPKFSADSRHVAYIALEETGTGSYRSYVVNDTTIAGPFNYLAFDIYGTDELVFSPDSRHFAYRAWEGTQSFLYFDGQKRGPYSGIVGPPPLFSPDSKRLAYFAADSVGSRVMMDTTPGPTYARVSDLAGFSDDSRSFSYLGISSDTAISVVKDSIVFGPYQRVSLAVYRPGTRDLWYSAARDTLGLDTLYVNGKSIASYRRFLELAFSDNGKRMGYIAEDSLQSVIVVDSTTLTSANRVDRLVFSPRGRHYTYRIRTAGDSATARDSIFVDTKSFGPYAWTSPVVFSPNGARYLFVAVDSLRKYTIITDSATYGPFDSAAVVGWSSDSRRFAFTTEEKGNARMFVNGKAEQPYRHVMRQVWHDTLHGTAAYVADPEAPGVCLVANDSLLLKLDFYYGSARSFTSDGTLRGYGQRGDTILQYVIRRTK